MMHTQFVPGRSAYLPISALTTRKRDSFLTGDKFQSCMMNFQISLTWQRRAGSFDFFAWSTVFAFTYQNTTMTWRVVVIHVKGQYSSIQEAKLGKLENPGLLSKNWNIASCNYCLSVSADVSVGPALFLLRWNPAKLALFSSSSLTLSTDFQQQTWNRAKGSGFGQCRISTRLEKYLGNEIKEQQRFAKGNPFEVLFTSHLVTRDLGFPQGLFPNQSHLPPCERCIRS